MKKKRSNPIITKWLNMLKRRNYSKATLSNYCKSVEQFLLYISSFKSADIREITSKDIEAYIEWLRTGGTGNNLANSSIQCKVGNVNQFFLWVESEGYIIKSPFVGYDKSEWVAENQPRVSLTQEEVELLFDQIKIHTPKGFRDRTLLELLYTTGIRRSEAINLNVGDINFSGKLLFIKDGKGKKDRVLPLTESCVAYLEEYMNSIRGTMLRKDSSEEALFLNRFGDRFAANTIGRIIREYSRAAKIPKRVTTHTMRHTFASHMIQNGARIRYVQELLGHEKVSTTMIYTKCNLADLRKAVKMFHPRENQLYEVVDRDEYRNKE